MINISDFKIKKIMLILHFIGYLPSNAICKVSNLDNTLVFDEKMLRGSNISQNTLSQIIAGQRTIPGDYKNTPISLNGYIIGNSDVMVREINDSPIVCLSQEIVNKIGLSKTLTKKYISLKQKYACVESEKVSANISTVLNSELVLEINAPQTALKSHNGEISESALTSGSNVIFTNYVTNFYHNRQSDYGSGTSNYGYLSLNSGINLGLWQFRQLSTYNHSQDSYASGKNTNSKWNNISTYVQRPLYGLKSNLRLGKTNTSGQFFGGVAYDGAELSSDERMYPVAQQGYAPVISGIAKTNALIEVRQNNSIIYQTNVPPGAFEIRDINPTSYNGDLNITIIESDGSKSSFSVPFSSVPDSVRPGKLKYTIIAGRTREMVVDKSFIDSIVQYGLNNVMTLGGGVRLAENYNSGVISTVFASDYGAVGINGTLSSAKLGDRYGTKNGGMTSITYSKTLQPMGTNISMAGYRYSTAGYREFSDFIYERYYIQGNESGEWSSTTYQQKYRLTAAIYQPMGDLGNISLSTTTQEYRGNRSRDISYQMSYSKNLFNRFNTSFSLSRQKRGVYYNSSGSSSDYDTVAMINVNIPFGTSGTSMASSVYFQKGQGNQYQAALSGIAGDKNAPYSYNLNVSHSEQPGQTSYAANFYKQYPLASVSVNGAKGHNYTQLGGGMTGALVVHSGGVLLGPYLGDTFGIIEAKGATGAKVYNGQGAVINHFGYALVPSLMPYRYNSVGLTSDGLVNNNVDIESSERRVAPYGGSAILLKFKTNKGYPLLVKLNTRDNAAIPIGAMINDSMGKEIGITGQNNTAYFRTEKMSDRIQVSWGERSNQKCFASYRISEEQTEQSLIKVTLMCN
ncbi:fimbrial biogenesis outer membrane usher protein [Escherichia coli]|nr:fimbrial biogenesis outer membrane usher protein [Escherichia coli]